MKPEAIEHAIELLVTMVVEERALREKRTPEEVFKKFRRSKTYEELFDQETGLWMNGPDYISDEYDIELQNENP